MNSSTIGTHLYWCYHTHIYEYDDNDDDKEDDVVDDDADDNDDDDFMAGDFWDIQIDMRYFAFLCQNISVRFKISPKMDPINDKPSLVQKMILRGYLIQIWPS